ncbi:MAG: DUF2202 domain-containing protein [Sulfurovum sp.]|nr:DUF2202 domain-containing protein [Sulfurovum sp.]
MKKQTITFILLATALFMFAGCGTSGIPDKIKKAIEPLPSGKPADIGQELSDALFYTMDEERLAYDIYNGLYNQHGTKEFTNVAKSEYLHIQTIQGLFKKYFLNNDNSSFDYANVSIEDMPAGTYDIPSIQNLYNSLILRGSVSEIAALQVGCMVEVTKIDDLNENIEKVKNAHSSDDISTVLTFLRQGGYDHYWAFSRKLQNKGVGGGCCSLGIIGDKNYCHPNYPQPPKSGLKRRRKRV